jgi:hypothetical protein
MIFYIRMYTLENWIYYVTPNLSPISLVIKKKPTNYVNFYLFAEFLQTAKSELFWASVFVQSL